MAEPKIHEEPFAIGIERVEEYEDGSATYHFICSEEASEKVQSIGMELILYCAAVNMDIQDALNLILSTGNTTNDTD